MGEDISVRCPFCQCQTPVRVQYAGCRVSCPSCAKQFEIPIDLANPVPPPRANMQRGAGEKPLFAGTSKPPEPTPKSPPESIWAVFFETRPCKYCQNQVASNANSCPKCGGRNPYPIYFKEVLGGCLVLLGSVVVGLVVLGAILSQISPTGDESPPTPPRERSHQTRTDRRPTPPANSWTLGGTLHNATLKEWREASYRNRLATAADFVAATAKNRNLRLDTTQSLRRYAEELEACISATAAESHPAIDHQRTNEIAAACMVNMDN